MADAEAGRERNGRRHTTRKRGKAHMADQGTDQAREGVNAQGGADSAGKNAAGVNVDATMQRAEAAVDVAAQRMGKWAVTVGHGMQRMAARAREEGEDILAEAQHLRHDWEHREGATPEP